MESGPLPQHERTWRHPSEIAAAEREYFATTKTKMPWLALITAAVFAVSGGFALLLGQDSVRSVAPSTSVALGLAALDTSPQRLPLATPVLDGSVALIRTAQLPATEANFTVELSTSTNTRADARVVRVVGEYSVVALATPGLAVPIEQATNTLAVVVTASTVPAAVVAVATTIPERIEIVHEDPPTAAAFTNASVPTTAALAVRGATVCSGPDGAPVLNDEGLLIGLCGDDGHSIVSVVGLKAADVADPNGE